MIKKIIAIGAHYDDIEVRCGGSFAKFSRAGYGCTYVVVTTTPYYNPTVEEKRLKKYPSNKEIIEIRKNESRNGAKILGADEICFWDFKSTYYYKPNSLDGVRFNGMKFDPEEYEYLMNHLPGREFILDAARNPESVAFVAEFIRKRRPDIILTHTPDDLHQEHYATATLVCKAVRKLATEGIVVKLYGWEPGSNGPMISFIPTNFVDMSETIKTKLNSVDCFPSQHKNQQAGLFRKSMRERGRYWGDLIGVEYAEAFREFDLLKSGAFNENFRINQDTKNFIKKFARYGL